MLVSRNALQSYPSLRGENCPNYFRDRDERDRYFENATASIPEYVAIAANGEDPATTDWALEVWQVEYFNGINWIAVNLSKNFALLVTNEGIKALTNASAGQYKLELSRILIKQSLIPAGEDVASWTFDDFVSNYEDICIDTFNVDNTTFTLENNVTHKTNLLNGGIQFTLLLDTNCMGQRLTTPGSAAPSESEFTIATIGLCVKDQRINPGEGTSPQGDTLFAVACLPSKLEKVATTPSQIGNSIKLYLNTTLSNFQNVVNLPIEKSSVSSVPEVVSEDDLVDAFPAGSVNSPHNLYVIDNYAGTNLPALAVRKGNPVSVDNPVEWTYFTPTDDTLDIDHGVVDSSLKNFMIASWDGQKYIPTNSKEQNTQIGLYVNDTIIYAGKVNNSNTNYNYNITTNDGGLNYHVGDILTVTSNNITFNLTITDVDLASGSVLTYIYSPLNGNVNISSGQLQPTYHPSSAYRTGSGLVVTITSSPQQSDSYIPWQFPASWVNKPLFADYNHNGGEASGYTWNSYCAAAGIPTSSNKNRSGYLTPVENEFTTSHFVGWCIDENTIKLALDLRNEASYAIYGTTRYATHAETANTSANPGAYETTSVVPRNLKRNYLQITMPTISESDADENLTNDGSTRAKAIKVDTYTTFTKSIECTGTDLNGVAFKGTAYRALWEDLAEYYRSDKVYPAGTLITVGSGINEISIAKTECNGIISQKPGYQLGEKTDQLDLPVALVGKVPVLFSQDCVPHFGDRIYLSKNDPGKASIIPFGKCLGKIIDKREHLDQFASLMCSVRIEF